jgi:signal peptidase II
MIIGGALGNILDRIPDGYVTDFLHLNVNKFSFFIFNPADAFISIGAILLIYLELFKRDHVSKSQGN